MDNNQINCRCSLFFDEGMLGWKNNRVVGEAVQFIPNVKIYHYMRSRESERYMRHVFDSIYEFSFRAISRYPNNLHQDCCHYIIEIDKCCRMFHYNWVEPYYKYIELNRSYTGIGSFSNCGKPHECNKYMQRHDIKSLVSDGQIVSIRMSRLLMHCEQLARERSEAFIDEGFVDDIVSQFIAHHYGDGNFDRNIQLFLERNNAYLNNDANLSNKHHLIYEIQLL